MLKKSFVRIKRHNNKYESAHLKNTQIYEG